MATTPETLSRLIGRLEDEGVLEWDGADLRLADRAWRGVTLRT
ncbi:MAG: hypothetical protein ACOC6J_11745 [Spirochaetota bacterium]